MNNQNEHAVNNTCGIFLGLGSNLGDRLSNLNQALERLSQANLQVVKRSSVYESAAWGKTDQPAFLNMVVLVSWIHAKGTPEELLQNCLSVEQHMGRVRTEKWGPRIIDIDVLAYNDLTICVSGLTIPHPQFASRAFVLVPWAQIAPTFRVIGFLESVQSIKNALPATERASVKIVGE